MSDHPPAPTLPATKVSAAEISSICLERKGKFQCILIVLLSLNHITVGINHTITTFHIYVPEYFCRDDPAAKCGVYVNGTRCPSGYEFDKNDAYSVAVEWSLVCDRRMLAPLINTLYFVGVTLGALVCSALSDSWGRRKLVLVCMYGQVLMAFGQYASWSLVLFCIFRMTQGFFVQGVQSCSYTLMLEYCPSKYRTMCSSFWELTWALGLVILGATSYFVRDWRLLTLLLTGPTLVSVFYSWFFPESINWLLARGEQKEALRLVQKIATFNNSYDIVQQCHSFDMESLKSSADGDLQKAAEVSQSRLWDIIRNRIIRKHLLSMIGIWFSVTLSYYGVLYYLPNLAGERHLNFLIGAFIEAIAYVLAYFVLSRFGRRLPMTFYQYANGLLLIIVGILTTLSDGGLIKQWFITIITLLAKGLAVSSFCGMFIYCSELLPTIFRGRGLGFCGFAARCGSLLAPQLMALVYYWPEFIPLLIMAVLLLLTASVTLLLPETLFSRMPNTINESNEIWAPQK